MADSPEICRVGRLSAAMEPGLGDREWSVRKPGVLDQYKPQWSPVLETGNGAYHDAFIAPYEDAAMEPGLGDREWHPGRGC